MMLRAQCSFSLVPLLLLVSSPKVCDGVDGVDKVSVTVASTAKCLY